MIYIVASTLGRLATFKEYIRIAVVVVRRSQVYALRSDASRTNLPNFLVIVLGTKPMSSR